jgi:transcriptional regulator with XRE-family HTH domain
MKLIEYRKQLHLSQAQLAEELSRFSGKYICPRTVGHWELGGMPRKFWREQLRLFTGGQVTPTDFD